MAHIDLLQNDIATNPQSGYYRVYFKSDGFPYYRNNAGTETAFTVGSLSDYVTIATPQTITGAKTFSAAVNLGSVGSTSAVTSLAVDGSGNVVNGSSLSGGQVNSVVGSTNITIGGSATAPQVDLNSAITGTSVNNVTLSDGGLATNFLNETGNYTTPVTPAISLQDAYDNGSSIQTTTGEISIQAGTNINATPLLNFKNLSGTTTSKIRQDGNFETTAIYLNDNTYVGQGLITADSSTLTLQSVTGNGRLVIDNGDNTLRGSSSTLSLGSQADYINQMYLNTTDNASITAGKSMLVIDTTTRKVERANVPIDSLQDAYDASTTPEITTDATRGALTIKRGSALDTDNVFEVQDGTGANTFEVTGEGFTSAIVFNVLNGGQLRLNGAGTSAISLNDDGTNKGVIYATETYLYLSHPTEVLIGGTTAKVSGNLDVTGTRADVNILESSGTATFGGLVTAVADMDVGNNLDVTGLTSLDGDATFDRNSTTFDVMGMSTDLNLSNLNTAITVGHYVTASTPTGLPTGWGGRIDLTITGAIVYRKQVVVNYDASPAVDFGKTMSRVTTTATNPTPTWTDWKEVVTSDVDGNIFIEDNTTGSTVAGNLWRDGNNLKFRDASVTKNLTHNASSLVSTPTLTVDIGLYTQFSLRSISDPTVTIAAPTNGGSALGPSHDGQKLTLRFRDNNTSRTLSWNAIFRAIGVTLPLSTTAFKTLYVGCIYHGAEGKWDVVAVSEEA